MNEKNTNSNIGSALAFYAKFTGECDLIWGSDRENLDQFHADYFKHLKEPKFASLIDQTDRIMEASEFESRQLIDAFKAKAQSAEFVRTAKKIQAPKVIGVRNLKNWLCRIRIEEKGVPIPERHSVNIGLILTSLDTIYARGWIWARGISAKETKSIVERHSSPKFTGSVNCPDWGPKDGLTLTNESLLTAIENGESADDFVTRIFAPFLTIHPKAWAELIAVAKNPRQTASQAGGV